METGGGFSRPHPPFPSSSDLPRMYDVSCQVSHEFVEVRRVDHPLSMLIIGIAIESIGIRV
jgi:hypothetical protein